MEIIDLAEMLIAPRPYVERTEVFSIIGTPVPWKRACENGRTKFTHPKAKAWMEQIAWQVSNQWKSGPTDGMCCLDIIAALPRPKNHYRSDSLRDDAPFLCPSHRAGDFDNFLKLACDALQKNKHRAGILYNDDSQIVGGSSYKVFSDGMEENLRGRGNVIPTGLILQFSLVDDSWRP